MTTGRTNERTDSRSPIYPNLFLEEVYKSYQKLTLEILKKSTYLVKVPFFHLALIPFHIKKKTYHPPPNFFSVLIKFDTAHIFIPPAIQWEGVYSICPFDRECFPHCLCNSSLNNLMELNESYRKSLIPYGKVH